MPPPGPRGRTRYPKTARFGIFRIAAKSIAALLDPETNLILDGKPLGGCAHEL